MRAETKFSFAANLAARLRIHREGGAKNFRTGKPLNLDRWAYQSIQDKGPPPSEWMQAIARFGQSQHQTGLEQEFSTVQKYKK